MVRLLRAGFNVSPAAPGLRYDLIADCDGTLLRFQVKGTNSKGLLPNSRAEGYRFTVWGQKRSAEYYCRADAKPRRGYAPDEIDWFCFVSLIDEAVVFLPASEENRQTIRVTVDRFNQLAARDVREVIEGCVTWDDTPNGGVPHAVRLAEIQDAMDWVAQCGGDVAKASRVHEIGYSKLYQRYRRACDLNLRPATVQ